MSIQAVSWVLNQRVGDPTRKLVLIGLADHATKEGEAAWPGVKSLAEYAECSARSVQRHLRQLETDGFIRTGDQRMVDHLQANRRPIVWDVRLSPLGGAWGDTQRASGVTASANTPHIEPSIEPSARSTVEVAFATFWASYPRREGKKAALAAFERAVRWLKTEEALEIRDACSVVIVGAQTYAGHIARNNIEARYVKQATTWLNQGCWDAPTVNGLSRREGAANDGVVYS